MSHLVAIPGWSEESTSFRRVRPMKVFSIMVIEVVSSATLGSSEGISPEPPALTRKTLGRAALVGAVVAAGGAGVAVTTRSTTCGVPATTTVSLTTTGAAVGTGAGGGAAHATTNTSIANNT